ncbi:MAG: hypothetical protein EG826_17505 [Deltaproteobacteria bacterium]|nr:hypothetical protein [Deltaproteobacteria bacterium]
MKKQSDRIKDWRARQKAEGKTSVTVLLSGEARLFLAEEKEKTGESYAVIIEKALQSLKKHGYRTPALKHFSNRKDVPERISARDHQSSVIPRVIHENGVQPKILIDDLANYPRIEDIKREQALKKKNGLQDLNFNEGLFTRLLRSSAGIIGIGPNRKRFK